MKESKRIRAIKGVLLAVAFLGIALSIMLQPDRGAVGYLERVGVHAAGIFAWFMLSAVMCFISGITYREWNALWFAPFFIYTGMTWVAVLNSNTNPPLVSGFAYTLLSGLLLLDLLADLGVFDRSNANAGAGS